MKNVITVVGGLGNQMFQYAFSLSLDPGDVYLNDYLASHGQSNYGSELNRVFGIKLNNNTADNFLVWLVRKCAIFSHHSGYPKLVRFLLNVLYTTGIQVKTDYLDLSCNKQEKQFHKTIWYGRFQSEKHFLNCVEKVKESFFFETKNATPKTQEVIKRMMQENSVSIHVRRGDYLDSNNLSVFGNICTLDYYNKAIKYIIETIENPRFYIFSDDISWVKENLKLPNAYYIDWNGGIKSWEDMYLMSSCKHNIIANSTFSWWGGWLNKNPEKKVLCPPKYTNFEDSSDFFPETWIKVLS